MRTIKIEQVKKYLLCDNCELDKGYDECQKCGTKIKKLPENLKAIVINKRERS